MRILVTGGAGYIGSHMVRMLVKKGIDVVVLDSMEFGHRQAIPDSVPLIVGNVADHDALSKLFTTYPCDGVMHFAGYLSVEESMRLPIKYMNNNVIGPVALLEAMREHQVKHIIFSSTAAVYGNPQSVPIPEDHPKNPVSPYGLSKWAFEALLRVYDRSYGITSIALRYFNAAGASLDGLHGELHAIETHLIPLACKAALGQRDSFSVFGTDYPTPDGSALRDFIHIEDLGEAHILTLNALLSGHASDVYNVGTASGVSVKEIVSQVRSVAKNDFLVHEKERRAGDPAMLIADSSRLTQEFGWRPQHSDIHTIIASAWKWHRDHPNGYEDRN